MKKLVFISLLFVMVQLATAQTTNNYPQPTNDSIVNKGVTDQTCALEIQFGSYGSGIDGKTYDKIIAFIESKKIKYTSKNIGREGEKRLCLPLTGVSEKKKRRHIEQLKKIARSGFLTSLSIR